MEGNYSVIFGKQTVGRVQVLKEGLYYRFICRCKLSGDVVCRLAVRCADMEENLGVVIPMDGGFGLDKRIPVKRFSGTKPEFYLMPKHDRQNERFAPIYPDEPFAYIANLKDAFLVRHNGTHGIILRKS